LQKKGFEIEVWSGGKLPDDKKFPPTPESLRSTLEKASQVWVISSSTSKLSAELCTIIKDFHQKGHGVFVWGDNDPMNVDCNRALQDLLPGVTLSGNHCGSGQVLKQAAGSGAVGFVPHLITTGVESLFEGHTIAEIKGPTETHFALGLSSAKTIFSLVCEQEGKRMLIDCGWTKLFYNWDSAGTDRYVVNCAAWLCNVERFGGGGGGGGEGGKVPWGSALDDFEASEPDDDDDGGGSGSSNSHWGGGGGDSDSGCRRTSSARARARPSDSGEWYSKDPRTGDEVR
jgi:hypothetical protein